MKTTKQHYEDFKRYSLDWQKKLGLLDWEIGFRHEPIKHAYARTRWKMSAAFATVSFCTNWESELELSQANIQKTALHEMLHLLLAQMVCEAEDRYTNQTAIDIAEHRIIRTLESVFLDA